MDNYAIGTMFLCLYYLLVAKEDDRTDWRWWILFGIGLLALLQSWRYFFLE